MPSKAYKTFQANLEHVNSIKNGPLKKVKGNQLNVTPDKKGRRNKRKRLQLNNTNRAALIVLCASWQQYIQDVALDSGDAFMESMDMLVKSMNESLNLLESEQEKIDGSIKKLKRDLTILKSATICWNSRYKDCIKQATEKFRSPTCKYVNFFLDRSIGVTCGVFSQSDFFEDGRSLEKFIKKFVDIRNQIAHEGVQNHRHIALEEVVRYVNVISKLVAAVDNDLKLQLTKKHPKNTSPWRGMAK